MTNQSYQLESSKIVTSSNRQKTWDSYFISLCCTISSKSKDPRTRVGCCIVDKSNKIISTGYNGFPSCIVDDPKILATREVSMDSPITKYDCIIHAEMNALLHAKTDLFGTTLYCTHHPCISGGCLKHIIACGIHRVVYLYDYDGITDREKYVVRNLVSASGIKFDKYNNA